MGAWLRGRPPGGAGTRGQVLVVFALGLVALLGAAGIAFDAGRFLMERRSLQNAADAAALAAANSLIRGGSTTDADTEARAVLATNLANGPNGIVAPLPPASPVYAPGGAGEPAELVNGILISGGDVRVAIQNTIPFTLGRVVGMTSSVVGARARVALQGDLLPIAVRRYINLPGPNVGATAPCALNTGTFFDVFATETTSCLGTDSDPTLRSAPNAGATFDSTTPGSDPTNHGPVVEILGQGAQPNGTSDFRGFIALDIRNFAAFGTQLYYNNVTSGTQSNTLKAMEAGWISGGGYPGPMFPPATAPPDPNDQVAVMAGNATGIAIDAVNERFAPGDAVLVAVYPGQVMAIPDFTLGTPPLVALPASGTVANGGSFRVGTEPGLLRAGRAVHGRRHQRPGQPDGAGHSRRQRPDRLRPGPRHAVTRRGHLGEHGGHLDERGRPGYLRRLDPGAGRQPLPDHEARAARDQDRIGQP